MVRIDIKPLSVNDAYRGRRFATKELTQYKYDLGYLLPAMEIPSGRLAVEYVFGVSSKVADGDNFIKAFQDCVAERYGFNDRVIYEWQVFKVDVPVGKEFVEYKISTATGRYQGDGSV